MVEAIPDCRSAMSRQAKLRSVDDFGLHGDVSQEVKRVLPCQLIRAGTLWIYGGSLELVVEGKIIGPGEKAGRERAGDGRWNV
jgi:hypothetical protein